LTLNGNLWYGMKPLNVGLRIIVDKKVNNLKDLEIWADLNFLSSIVSSQLDKRKTKNLEKMSESIIRVIFYFQEYSNNIRLYKKALSEYRLTKNRAIERARKAEKENEKLRKQNESLSI
jgi:alanine-alpha-ketoisovalerate/valine-pyruvate aminotransferase|tara:strand:- start:1518 stop:1874 length:357 start_codon:yes stop_codon:yes gene_type:complete